MGRDGVDTWAEVVRKLGAGADPASLDLRRLPDGYLDLRKAKFHRPATVGKISVVDRGVALYRPGKTKLVGVRLQRVDLTGADIRESIWEDFHFEEVRMDRIKAKDTIFATGRMERVTFTRADLRGTHYGQRSRDSPHMIDVDFVDCDLRGSTYSHPQFQRSRFSNANLTRVNFFGSRFEECVFEGLVDEVIFNGWDSDPDPKIQALRNPMRNVDFSRAELKYVAFSRGIDITTCRLPAQGYILIPHPRQTLQRALEMVEREWSGKQKDNACAFFRVLLEQHFPVEQPLYLVRIADFDEYPLGKETGRNILEVIRRATQTTANVGTSAS